MPKRTKTGRPTKYRKDFHPADFIRLSKGGKNLTQIALEWDIDPDTIHEWVKKHKDFSDSRKKGRAFCEAWYINLGQAAMVGEAQINGRKIKVDLGMFVWLTKNIFKWSDKTQDVSPKADTERPLKDLSDEELDAL